MTDQDLARRAVACPRWRWLPGMLVMSDPQSVPRPVQMTAPASSELRARVTSTVIGRWFGVFEYCVDHPDAEHETASGDDLPGTLPDLTDPATLGCLLALVREAWTDPRIHAAPALYSHEAPPKYRYTISHWHVYSPGPYDSTKERRCSVTGKTEAEALVKALEAAP